MRFYGELERLLEEVRGLDRARATDGSVGAAAVRVELAALAVVESGRLHERRDALKAELVAHRYLGDAGPADRGQANRTGPEGQRASGEGREG